MKRNLIRLALVLAIFPLLGSLPAAAVERPLSLTGAGTMTNGVVNASGRATHLGLFTETGELSLTPDPNNPNLILASGHVTFTAANGDTVEALLEDGVLDVTTGIATGIFRFIGGTGRFEGTTGTGDFVVLQNLVTGAFEVTAVGTINY